MPESLPPADDVESADPGTLDRAASALVGRLMDLGIDGIGPLDSAAEVVQSALQHAGGDPDRAVKRLVSTHRRLVAAQGFVTGVGGLVTMPVALPANLVGFYVLATRLVAGIATVRGYDVARPQIRSAILLTLVGADASDVLGKAGVLSTGRLATLASSRLPASATMMVNKAVGFRLMGQLGQRSLSRLGRFVPIAGGVIGAGLDTLLIQRIASHAREEFPPA